MILGGSVVIIILFILLLIIPFANANEFKYIPLILFYIYCLIKRPFLAFLALSAIALTYVMDKLNDP